MKISEILEVVDRESIEHEYIPAILKEESFQKDMIECYNVYRLILTLQQFEIYNLNELNTTDFPERPLINEFRVKLKIYLYESTPKTLENIQNSYPSFNEISTELRKFFLI